jgi:hypothetical protein
LEHLTSRITVSLLTYHSFPRYPSLTHAFSTKVVSPSFQDRVLTAFWPFGTSSRPSSRSASAHFTRALLTSFLPSSTGPGHCKSYLFLLCGQYDTCREDTHSAYPSHKQRQDSLYGAVDSEHPTATVSAYSESRVMRRTTTKLRRACSSRHSGQARLTVRSFLTSGQRESLQSQKMFSRLQRLILDRPTYQNTTPLKRNATASLLLRAAASLRAHNLRTAARRTAAALLHAASLWAASILTAYPPTAFLPSACLPTAGLLSAGLLSAGLSSAGLPPAPETSACLLSAYAPPAHVPPAHVPPAHVPPAHVPPAHVPPTSLPTRVRTTSTWAATRRNTKPPRKSCLANTSRTEGI